MPRARRPEPPHADPRAGRVPARRGLGMLLQRTRRAYNPPDRLSVKIASSRTHGASSLVWPTSVVAVAVRYPDVPASTISAATAVTPVGPLLTSVLPTSVAA